MGGLSDFSTKIWEEYGKIKVHHTKANIEDKFESKFLHLNITIF